MRTPGAQSPDMPGTGGAMMRDDEPLRHPFALLVFCFVVCLLVVVASLL